MIWCLIFALGLAADILSKLYITNNFRLGETLSLIEDKFHITYVLNDGAAFSIFKGQRLFLIIVTVLIIIAFLAYIIKNKPESKFLKLSLSIIISGACGNLIDRILYGKVVDFIDVRLINFPVFNVADCLVVIGTVLLCIYLLFKQEKRGNDGEEDVQS